MPLPFKSPLINNMGFIIRYDLMRIHKPLHQITPDDIPRGFDAEDVACMPPEYPCHLCKEKMRKK